MLGVILNPNALGVRRRPGLRARLHALVGARGLVVETHSTEELAETVRRFAAAGVDLVATAGGDGTNLLAVTELVRAYGAEHLPRLAVLRGGTVNTVAENLDVHGRTEAILRRLIARLDDGAPLPERGQDLIEVTRDAAPPLYGFLFAAAMGARFLEAYYGGAVPGPSWAVALTLRTVASSFVAGRFARWLFSPVPMRLTVDEQPVQLGAPRLLVASTVPDVGLGMRVAWQAQREPGRFNVIASGLTTTQMAFQLHRVLGARPLEGGPHFDALARSAEIAFAERETFTLDGELFSADHVRISSGPRLRVVAL
jgi:diacylglycerol kinase family enzyme